MNDTVTEQPSNRLSGGYWRLWTASTISNLGDGMFIVALPLLAARTTDSSVEVALVTTFAMLPWLLVSPFAGAFVDRYDKRHLMISCDTFRALLILGLTVIVATDTVQMWMLWFIAFFLGIAEVVFDNAAQAILPNLVEPRLLEKANGRRYSAEITANVFIGTPLGGALFALAVWLPFGIDALTYLAAALLVVPLRGTFRTPTDPENPTTLTEEIRAGFRWLWSSTILRGLAITLAITNLGLGMTAGVFILYLQQELGVSEVWYGAMLGIMALGGITAGLVGERVISRLGKIRTLYSTAVVWALAISTTGLFPVLGIVLVAETVGVFAVTLWNVCTVSLRQQLVPPALFGRVNSVYRWFAWGAMPVGALIGGVIAENSNQRVPYLFSAACIALGIVVMSRSVTTETLGEAGGSNF